MKVNKKKVQQKAVKYLGLGVGGIGAGYAKKMIPSVLPMVNAKLVSGIPVALGILLEVNGKPGDMLDSVGSGMIAGGLMLVGKDFGIGDTGDEYMLGIEEEVYMREDERGNPIILGASDVDSDRAVDPERD